MPRLNDDFVSPGVSVLSARETRQLAQRRAYERWNKELAKKHRGRLNEVAEPGFQDLTNLEHLATKTDLARLDELLREELAQVGQRT